MMEEINSICNLEWRKYNWSIMPNNVHSPNAYAWKLYIIAEVYTEYDTFMWVDTSFTIEDVKSLDPIFNSIESGNISETVFPGNAQHSIHFATNLRTFTYLPIITDWIKLDKWDAEMYEANFIIIHKSEHTRKLLKWTLLCASTKECIEPEGSELYCTKPLNTRGTCHRRDQSAFGIINVNLEYKRSLTDEKFIPHFNEEHPRKYSKHKIRRREKLDNKVDFKKEVACCKLPST
ncbi:hypothetical protein Mgra_00003449 [Meloidogyne graminicola]|uniref:Uncharacterized protein n=1 Tax=Meloidogyne graminicola TaxID=189291 RepID=A0A8S9ZV69_9BILA|nr:hypothetical protein Mgra_00003449 [Meloidogyne graminicola]